MCRISMRRACCVIAIILTVMLMTSCAAPAFFPEEYEHEDTPENVEEPDEPAEEDDPIEEPEDEPTEQPAPEPDNPDLMTNGQVYLDKPIYINSEGSETQIEIVEEDNSLVLLTATRDAQYELLIDEGEFLSAEYVTTPQGYSCLLLSYDEASDDYVTLIYTFEGTEAQPVLRDEVGGYIWTVDGDRFTVFEYIYAIGTWPAQKVYFILEDGTAEDVFDAYYLLDPDEWAQITVSRSLPVMLLENNEHVAYTLNPGAPLTFISTDGYSYMEFVLWDGTEGFFEFEIEAGLPHIDGSWAIDYFEGLPLSD